MKYKAALSALAMSIGLAFSTSLTLADEKGKSEETKSAKTADAGKSKDSISARAKMLAYTCAGCHGEKGASGGPAIPSIGGLSEDSFIEVMNAYKEGEGNPSIMDRIAKGYSEDDIKAMTSYFVKQEFVAAKQEVDTEKAKIGKKLHDKYCEKCHEEGGSLDSDGAGILAGRWKPYLQYSLTDYVKQERKATKKMAKKLKKLHKKEGDEGIAALIEYYVSQQPK